ncbi:MAG: hypothetical protein HYU64_17780 [Armatimonadetes bacterium]|nr:hypothetical protein [Armatimonadota bacterium]
MIHSVRPFAAANLGRPVIVRGSDRIEGEDVSRQGAPSGIKDPEVEVLLLKWKEGSDKHKVFKTIPGAGGMSPIDSVYRQGLGAVKRLGDDFFTFYYNTYPLYGTGFNWSQDVSGITGRLNDAVSRIRGIIRWTEKTVAEKFQGASPSTFLKAGFEKALENQKKMDSFPPYSNGWMENNRKIKALGEIYFAASTAVDLYDTFPQK